MIVFIPIKHNSQRVPRKNFRLFNGVPLYKHTLLKYSNEKVFVDTDSDEICDLIKNFILKYDIKQPIAQIHVTSPFLLASTVKSCYNIINEYDSVASCNVLQVRLWRKEEYGFCPVNHNPAKLEQTQDLPKYYEENSAFYIFKPEVLIRTGNRIGQNPFFYELKDPENLDIDTEEDWAKIIRIEKQQKLQFLE